MYNYQVASDIIYMLASTQPVCLCGMWTADSVLNSEC